MGINGLLPYLEAATRTCHISEFRGGSVAVDSYCFLHKGATGAAEELARGEDNQVYVQYCIKYVKMLLSYNIHPIMVFDGRNLPAKADTEAKRREGRQKAKQRGVELLRLGKTEEARNYLRRSIDITPKMAHNLIEACRELNVDCIVSPYESDAQLTFFDIRGIVDAVITEDSDLILFGCKKVVFKLDMTGAGRLVDSEKIRLAMHMRPDQYTFEKFRYMCILSGCDYLDSLYGIGLKKAEKFVKLTADTNPKRFLDKLPGYLKMKSLVVTEEYKTNFMIANATFLHQVVFDPFQKKLVHLHHPHKTGTNPDYIVNCGDKFDDEQAYQIAIGNRNPYKEEFFSDWTPEEVSTYSIWSRVFRKRISVKSAKETRQREFKSYFQTQKTTIESTTQILENEKVMEDTRIEKELSVYINKKLEMKENPEENTTCKESGANREETHKKSSISPIIAKNPFLKKKISKFPRTHTDSSVIVKSRFFSEKIITTADDIEPKISEEECKEQSSEEIFITDDATDEDNGNKSENKSKTRAQHSNIQNCEVIIPIDNDPENKSDNVKKRSFEEMRSESAEKNLAMTSHDKKKKLLGPCRSVGLKKVSRQQTMHNFFNKLRK